MRKLIEIICQLLININTGPKYITLVFPRRTIVSVSRPENFFERLYSESRRAAAPSVPPRRRYKYYPCGFTAITEFSSLPRDELNLKLIRHKHVRAFALFFAINGQWKQTFQFPDEL